MGDKIEMSLDDIIKTNKIGFRRGGGGGNRRGGTQQRNTRPNNRGNQYRGNRPIGGGGIVKGRGIRGNGLSPRSKFPRGDVNSAWKHDMFEGAKKTGGGLRTSSGQQMGSAKLLVSNLDYGVSETDIHELFADFGPLKNASVHYDRSGRSLGTADVIFERRSDAAKAMKQYNGVPLDGRPMNIQFATSEVPVPLMVPRNRIGGNSSGNGLKNRGPPRRGAQQNSNRNGGVRDSGGRANGRQPHVTPTVEDLDAELDAYVNDMKL